MTHLPVPFYNLLTLFDRFDYCPDVQLVLLKAGARSFLSQCEQKSMKESPLGRGMTRGYYRKARAFCDWSKLQAYSKDMPEILTAWRRSKGLLKSWGEIPQEVP